MTYHNISKGTTAIAEYEHFEDKSSIHFSSWWSGEGGDFTLESKSLGKQTISLGVTDMVELFAMMVKTGFVDIKEVKTLVKEYKE